MDAYGQIESFPTLHNFTLAFELLEPELLPKEGQHHLGFSLSERRFPPAPSLHSNRM